MHRREKMPRMTEQCYQTQKNRKRKREDDSSEDASSEDGEDENAENHRGSAIDTILTKAPKGLGDFQKKKP